MVRRLRCELHVSPYGQTPRTGEGDGPVGWVHTVPAAAKATPLFRRNSAQTSEPHPTEQVKPGGKGRPTPSRREAEAAARERARLGKDRKALARRQRQTRMESSRQMRDAMKSGDEKHLPARDQGPVKRYIRDFVDARLGFSELLAPMLILIMLLGYGVAGEGGQFIANSLWFTTLALVIIDVIVLRFRMRKGLRERFPDEPVKGTFFYALMRALNMRFLRLPKPRVKIGQKLPEHYR